MKWKCFSLRKLKHEKCSVPLKKNKAIRAVAIPSEPSTLDSAEYRKQLCDNYGFRQIGEPLPDTITLKKIMDSLPKKVHTKSMWHSTKLLSSCYKLLRAYQPDS